jgi:hypothetical protein
VKTLINIDRLTWADVKKFATIQDLSLNSAVEHLLTIALDCLGYISKEGGKDPD